MGGNLMKLLGTVFLFFLFSFTLRAGDPLAPVMQQMGKSFTALSRQVSDPAQLDSSLKLTLELINLTQKSKTLSPELYEVTPEQEKEFFLKDYQLGLDQLLVHFSKLQTLLQDKEFSLTKELLLVIGKHLQASHQKFRETRTLPQLMQALKTQLETITPLIQNSQFGEKTMSAAQEIERLALRSQLRKPASLSRLTPEQQVLEWEAYKQLLKSLAQNARDMQIHLPQGDAVVLKKDLQNIGLRLQEGHRRFKP